jgi:hypothetical protein
MNVCGCSVSPQNKPGSFRLLTSVLALPSTIWKKCENEQTLKQDRDRTENSNTDYRRLLRLQQ